MTPRTTTTMKRITKRRMLKRALVNGIVTEGGEDGVDEEDEEMRWDRVRSFAAGVGR